MYYIEDLRNIYRLYDIYSIVSISDLFVRCQRMGLRSWSGKEWTQRGLLEATNALKNFKLLSVADNHVIKPGLFASTRPDEPLSSEEITIFKSIYFSYFRFSEFHSLFKLSGESLNSDGLDEQLEGVVFYFMHSGRFTNSFIVRSQSVLKVYEIADEHADMMRFWDVYLKWGTALGLLKKYPLKPFGVSTIPASKGLSIAFFSKELPKEFSVFEYALKYLDGSYLYIPDVIFSIIMNRHYSVEDIKERIKNECISHAELFRAQSTSAIFINEKEAFLFPQIGNVYITHLLKL